MQADPARFQGLSSDSKKFICRSLGIYTRSRYRSEMLELLAKLVAIPSYRRKEIVPHKDPKILKIGKRLAEVAQSYGLAYRNYENRIFEIFLKARGSQNLGIFTHADVVPANPKLWQAQTKDSSSLVSLDPFKMQIIGDRMYGRGTQDDKGPIVISIMAMRTLLKARLPLKRGIRLMIESTEETGGEGLEYYKKKAYPLPAYNIVLDSKYPLVIAEKGAGLLQLSFSPIGLKAKQDLVVYSLSGGTAVNQIPGLSTIKIKSSRPQELKEALEPVAQRLEKEAHQNRRTERSGDKKLKVEILAKTKEKEVHIQVYGISAHSSEPEKGLNPVPYALMLLYRAQTQGIPLAQNEYMQAAKVAAEILGLDYLGKKLGISHSNDFMGPLTFALTQLEQEKSSAFKQDLHLRINIRLPRGLRPQELEAKIRQRLKQFQTKNKLYFFEIYFKVAKPMYRNPKGAWIETLLNIFRESTGDQKAKALSGAGTTSAQQIPNGISFGPSMPREKYRGHNANEYEKLSDFLLSSQMVTEMLCRVANLEQMR